jgi:hypothetical protein
MVLMSGDLIAWRVNKQDTVTMSSTEWSPVVSTVAISISRLFKAMALELNEPAARIILR